jgi:amino acid adenylation domain-containing protein
MTTEDMPPGLHSGFLRSAAMHPDRPALEVCDQTLSYAQLRQRAGDVAVVLAREAGQTHPKVGILASRSVEMYSGILGTLWCGGTVVPLNPAFPAERSAQMLALAEVSALVVDKAGESGLEALLAHLNRPLLLIAAPESTAALATRLPGCRVVAAESGVHAFEPRPVSPDDLAYIFFTSGSTGVPKGVGVLHRNASRFVEMSMERYAQLGLGCTDRFSQFYDITFDSSMFDLFVSWAFGACLCCPTLAEWVNPNKFIVARALSVIDIVPSTGHSMSRGNGWRPGRFAQLRLCRFGGEALSADLAATLAAAAPHAAIDNVYGPTECTVDAAYYRWDRERSPQEATHGVVPIGVAGPKVGLRVVDSGFNDVPIGADGELLISGPQVTPGYWRNPERTAQSFIRLAGSDVVHYRTGDLVRNVPPGQPIPYLGRMDYQIKIAGLRIELGEVEQAMRRASGTDLAVAVGWPPTTGGASGIVGFVVKPGAEGADIRRQLKQALPAVMVPKEIHVIDSMPLNVNGKIDRKALLERLKAAAAQD